MFNALLQPGDAGSRFSIELEDLVSTRQAYEPNTAVVLRTTLTDRSGNSVEITDFAPRFHSRSRYFRPVTLVRKVRPLHGAPRIRVRLKLCSIWGKPSRSSRAAATMCAMSARR